MKFDDSYIARRRFLCGMIGGGAGAIAAGAAVPLAFYAGNLHDEPPPLRLEIPSAQCDLAPGKSKLVMYGRIPALLVRSLIQFLLVSGGRCSVSLRLVYASSAPDFITTVRR